MNSNDLYEIHLKNGARDWMAVNDGYLLQALSLSEAGARRAIHRGKFPVPITTRTGRQGVLLADLCRFFAGEISEPSAVQKIITPTKKGVRGRPRSQPPAGWENY